jgi:pimeloyl-ACP methyl ester carboxylesterase
MLLNYTAEGSGETIVFLHGMAASSRYWEAYAPKLSANHRIIRLDLLGFGRSPASDSGYTVNDHLQAIQDTLEHVGLNKKFTLVGHSMGALLALKYAAKHPEQVANLILISMPIYRSPEEARDDITKSKKLLKFAYYGPSSHILCTAWCYLLRPLSKRLAPYYLRAQPRHVAEDSVLHTWKAYSQTMKDVIEEQTVQKDLDTLTLPVELVYGTEESKVVIKNASALNLPKNVRLSHINGGHNLPLEQVDTVSKLITTSR